jgi:DNA-binding SARP family transcriptional activator
MALLAYLAIARPRGFHRRDKLAALFWPELSTERARAALRSTLTRIRAEVHSDAIVTRGADEVGVDTSVLWCDVVALDDLIRDGRALDAAEIFHGDLLDGVHVENAAAELDRWIDIERARIRTDLVAALLAQSKLANKRADRAAALAAARCATSLAPNDERVHRLLIEQLANAGDIPSALRAYDDFVQTLQRDLQLGPSADTRAFADRLRASATTPAASPVAQSIGDASLATTSDPTPRHHVVNPPARRISRFAAGAIAAIVIVAATTLLLARARSTVSAAEPARWTSVITSGPNPMGRNGAHAVLDSTGDAIVSFGGVLYGGDPSRSRMMNDLWRLRGLRAGERASWTKLQPTGEPPSPRWLFGITYDAARDRAIMFGGARGFTSPCANDTWILDDASGAHATPAWHQVRVRGPLPPPRADVRLAYDAAARRLFFVGGHDCIREFSHDVWVLAFDDSTLSSGAWTRLLPDTAAGAPPNRSSYASAFDPASHRMFVFGGNAGGVIMNELWSLDNTNGPNRPAWRPLHCAGHAPALADAAAAYDSASHTWILFGGSDSSGDDRRDVWRVVNLDRPAACRWEVVAAPEPTPNARVHADGFFDAKTNTFVMQGGSFQVTGFSDAWTLRGAFKR